MDAQSEGTFQWNRVNDSVVFVHKRLLAHAVEAFHREDVKVHSLTVFLGNFKSLESSAVYHVLVFEHIALLCDNLFLADNVGLKLASEVELEVWVHSLNFLIHLF